ncbi:SagB family peptide dehydrogenase [Paenibacillus sp. sptzw28]|uniref:SagB family peptide dehydrogenase n=1 Tax=Paenibacillus sp. sptzw28 TaxID=715179 RepID=UPI001C6F2DE5|nr:SagB family peptide dehydrogenase [Paenibacillus sp. sptzw28]QYR19585.1 SagB family peptide dehydrogenase [Paenibacillus sp. sptzw28]
MSLKAFLHDLHFESDKAKPPDWEADWEDAPLPYKLYRRLPSFPLCAEVPLTLAGCAVQGKAELREVGHFLWYVFGLAQVSQSVFVLDSTADAAGFPQQTNRRFVPSGGGLYPNELYIYLKLEDLPAGIYHYDAAHHRLLLLREGNFDAYLGRALGNRCDVPGCFGVAFVSTMFWKNFFKYNNFSYRLQGLDAGVMIGQMLEAAKRFGYQSCVYFQYLDMAVNHLLGLSGQEESVYAVIPLSTDPTVNWFARGGEGRGGISALELSRELAAVRHDHYIRSRRVLEYPLLAEMNEASGQKSTDSFRLIESREEERYGGSKVILPGVNRLQYDLASVCRKRYSPESDYVLRQIGQPELAALLQEATASFNYRNDLDGTRQTAVPRVVLYGCFHGVEGIADGAYRYDGAAHELQLARPGDHRMRLQEGMSLGNINLFQVPLCFHVAGDKDHLQSQLGFRGYRIQQMEAGMLVQRLLLAAIASGMGGRPLLGFDAANSDEIQSLAPLGQTSLIQIPVGHYRGRPRLEGSLSR